MFEAPMEWRESWWRSPTDLDRRFGAWPVRAGRTRTKPHYHAGPRVKQDYSIHFIHAGTVRFRTREGFSASLSEGDAFVIFPQAVHEYWAVPADPPRMTWIAFQGPAAEEVLARMAVTPTAPTCTQLGTWRISPLAGQIASAFDRESARDSLRPVELLTSLFAELIDAVGRRTAEQLSWLEKGRRLLDAHCTDNVSVQEIAEQVGVDRSHFSKEFSRELGMSPARYLRTARLEQARGLLLESRLTVTEIALSVGYADLYAFSRAYRKHFGRPPSAEQGVHP